MYVRCRAGQPVFLFEVIKVSSNTTIRKYISESIILFRQWEAEFAWSRACREKFRRPLASESQDPAELGGANESCLKSIMTSHEDHPGRKN